MEAARVAVARIPNRTRQALLGFLSWGPQTGYGLRKVIEGSVSNFWTESYGRIYPMLRELEEQGLATSVERQTAGGRPTKTYSITDAGRRELATWLLDPPSPPARRNELLLKIFFSARGEQVPLARMIATFRDEQRADLEKAVETRRSFDAVPDPPEDMRFWRMALRYSELEIEAHLQWADEVLAQLEQSAPAPAPTPAPAPGAGAASGAAPEDTER